MNQLSTTTDFNHSMMELENTQKLCSMLMKTPHYSKMGSEGIFAVVSYAKSIDMDALEALNGGLYYVKGKVGMSSETMAARMRKAGHSITKDPKSNDQICILHGKRGDNGDTWMTSFSITDAKRAGIYSESGPWGKYPDVMCYNRALSKMYRQLTPDLSRGSGYTLDELKEIAAIPDMTPVTIEEEKKTITSEQVQDLKEILSLCEPTYEGNILIALKRTSPEVDCLEKIPANLFERIRNAALRKKEEFSKQKEEVVSQEEEEHG